MCYNGRSLVLRLLFLIGENNKYCKNNFAEDQKQYKDKGEDYEEKDETDCSLSAGCTDDGNIGTGIQNKPQSISCTEF